MGFLLNSATQGTMGLLPMILHFFLRGTHCTVYSVFQRILQCDPQVTACLGYPTAHLWTIFYFSVQMFYIPK